MHFIKYFSLGTTRVHLKITRVIWITGCLRELWRLFMIRGDIDSHLGEAYHSRTQHWELSHGSTLGCWNRTQLSHLEPRLPLPYTPGTLFSSLPYVQCGHSIFLILHLKDKYKIMDDTWTQLEAQSFLWLFFSASSAQEEMQAVLLLSGSWQVRKPLALCMPKPALGRHPHSMAFAQEGSVLKELFTAFTQYVFEY